MTKIVINRSFGGFTLTEKALNLLGAKWSQEFNDRTDANLITAVELLGIEAGYGLEIVEIPDGYYWIIVEKDGVEEVFYSTSPILRTG